MACIGITCLQLALYDPYDTDSSSTWNRVNSAVDYAALALFSTEMLLKHIAYGPAAYWEIGWNRLDGLVVTTGYISLIPGMDSLVLMKLLRVLRPLRIMNKVPGMKRLMSTLVASAKPLADTGMLCTALLFIFGIVGITLFAGFTRQQCYTPTANNTFVLDTAVERYCGGKFSCPTGDLCLYSPEAPNYSLTSFDHIATGFLTIFAAVTKEGWTDVMYILQDSFGYWSATLFFHVVVIFGSLFALNLALAVLADSFDADSETAAAASAPAEKEEKYSTPRLGSSSAVAKETAIVTPLSKEDEWVVEPNPLEASAATADLHSPGSPSSSRPSVHRSPHQSVADYRRRSTDTDRPHR